MQTPQWERRVLIAASLALTLFVFWKILAHQKSTHDVAERQKSLIETREVLQLRTWQAVFNFCYYKKGETTSENCFEDQLQGVQNIDLPLQKFENPLLNFEVYGKKESRQANSVHLTYVFSEAEKVILQNSNEWMLLIPRNSQRATFLGDNMAGVSQYGHVTDSIFGLTLNQLSNSGKIDLIINYKPFPRFGPVELPVVLAKPNSSREYLSLFEKQVGAAALSKQFLVGVPLVMSAVASVLDHSPTMLLLALFGACRAVFTYFGFLGESSVLELWQNLLSYASLGASLAMLLMFVEKLLGYSFKRIRMWHRVVFTFLCAGVCMSGHYIDHNFQITSSLWVDSLGSTLSLMLVAWSVWPAAQDKILKMFRIRKSQTAKEKSERSDGLALSRTLVFIQYLITAAAFAIYGSVNISELAGQMSGSRTFTDPLDWRHMMLMPALLTAGLLEVGSIARRMLSFGHEMAEKALIEKELQVGRDVQARMLPDKRFRGDFWQWRAVYHPAEALAGDWFDIREVEFSDGRKLLAVCLADVTGHGVGSSLSTSVICSHWSLWCARLGQIEFPADKTEREKILCTAPIKIHDGLSALRRNENCTAMIALIDPYAKEVSITSAGHPGALIIGPRGLRYVTTAGERLGGELMGEAKWNPRTEPIADDELLAIYSDGIVPVGVTVLSWAGQLKKKIVAGNAGPAELLLMRTLHDNKRAFMNDPANEDDMTLIMLRRGGSAAATL